MTLWLVIMAVAMFAAIGLVSDGGQALATKGMAISDAYGAARAGAESLNETSLRSGQGPVTLDVAAARQAATTFLIQSGVAPGDAQITVSADQVTVIVHLTSPAPILGAVGVRGFHVTGQGSAQPVRGVTQAGG